MKLGELNQGTTRHNVISDCKFDFHGHSVEIMNQLHFMRQNFVVEIINIEVILDIHGVDPR
jgi:hypothetical protein